MPSLLNISEVSATGDLIQNVYFAGFLSGVPKALFVLEVFQASVSSWGRACKTGTFWPEIEPGSAAHPVFGEGDGLLFLPCC